MTERKHNKLLAVGMGFLLILISVLGVCFAQAKETEQVPPTLRVGYIPEYGFFSQEYNSAGEGYGYEYLMEIAQYTGWDYEFVPCRWSEVFTLLETGQIDLFGPAQKTAEREQRFAYPQTAIGNESGGLFVPTSNQTIYYEDLESLQGIRVGAEKDSYFTQVFEAFCEENQVELEIVYTETVYFAEELQQGRYDAALSTSMYNIPDTMLVQAFPSQPCYFITNRNSTKVADELDRAIAKIQKREIYFHANLHEKYYGNSGMKQEAFTRKEREYLDNNPVLKVVADPSWPPISYQQEGKNKGISADVLREVVAVGGLTLDWLQVEDYLQCKQMIQSGEAQLMIPHTERPEELGAMVTKPFHDVATMVVGKEEIDMNAPLRVAVSNIQSLPAQRFAEKYPHFEMVPYANTRTLLEAFHGGEETFIYVNTYTYDDIIRDEGGGIYYAVPTDITYPLRFAVSKESSPLLVSVLNKSISRISQGKLTSLVFSNTVNRAYHMPFSRFVKENAVVVLTLLVLVFTVSMVLVVVINRYGKKKLEQMAFVDELTGLPTMTKFLKDAQQQIVPEGFYHYILASVDIDNFKYINDVFGYEVGNIVLQVLADYFASFPSRYDLMGKANADNFLFLIHGVDPQESLEQFEQMLTLDSGVMQGILPDNYKLVLSAGAYRLGDPQESFAASCDKANIARKVAKGSFKTTLQQYTDEMDTMIKWKKEVTLSMESALADGDFCVYLQPKYQFSDEKLAGAEALVRWKHPEKGLLSPAIFLPLFESNGFIVKLDLYVFEQTCMLLRKWMDQGYDVPVLSVNLSRLHLNTPSLVASLDQITRKHGVPPQKLELELTESVVLNDHDRLITVMGEMKRIGFSISVDDFGSGYSSLHMLTELPVDVLKLDKGFLDRLSDASNSWLIVEQVVELAKKLHLSTVAEGVETQRQVEFLRRLGCDLAQGYFFARPMCVEDFEKLLLEAQEIQEPTEQALQQSAHNVLQESVEIL